MITREMLTAHENVVVPAILAIAKEREGRRTERTLTEADVRVFLATVRKYPSGKIQVYAGRGAFVAQSHKERARITVLEYWPGDIEGRGGACVSDADARRPRGRGPWVMVDDRKEI